MLYRLVPRVRNAEKATKYLKLRKEARERNRGHTVAYELKSLSQNGTTQYVFVPRGRDGPAKTLEELERKITV